MAVDDKGWMEKAGKEKKGLEREIGESLVGFRHDGMIVASAGDWGNGTRVGPGMIELKLIWGDRGRYS